MKIIPKFLDDIRLRVIAVTALCITAICAWLFFWMNCLTDTVTQGSVPGWLDCLYFSAVTITSMGTSDLRPNTVGRIIQIVEVTGGLLLFGLVVAKLSSARTGFFLRRLYSSDAQKRLTYFDEAVHRLTVEMGEISKAMTSGHDVQMNGELLAIWLDEIMNVCIGAKKYVLFESRQGTFFQDVPSRAVRKLAKRLNVLILLLSTRWPKLVECDPERLKKPFFCKRVRCTARNVAGLCDCIGAGAVNEETLGIVANASRIANTLALSQATPNLHPSLPALLNGSPEEVD
jgi:hypothetical protein